MCGLLAVGCWSNNSNKTKSGFQGGGQRRLRTYLIEDSDPTSILLENAQRYGEDQRVTEQTVRCTAHPARARSGNRFPGEKAFKQVEARSSH